MQLAQAAKFSDAGRYSAAMAIYHQLFGVHPPPGDLAVAYYETEAATDGGRPRAIDGLRALVEKYPADVRYQISLGRVLIYDPATRQEGRTYLSKFPDYPQAAQAMRQSLLWDAANPAAGVQIRAYLAAHPDPQLAAVLQATQPIAAKAGAVGAAGSDPTMGVDKGASAAAASMPIVVTPASSRAADAASQALASAVLASPTARATVPPGTDAALLPSTPVTSAAQAAGESAKNAGASRPVLSAVGPPVATSAPTVRESASLSTADHAASRGEQPDGSYARSGAAVEAAAYQALNANRIDEAERFFKAILTAEPHDEKALAGMGYVRMQQGNFPGAMSYLEQAKQVDTANSIVDKGLLAALDTARFWAGMGEGHNALARNDLTTAEKGYRDALAVRPDNAEALEELGGTLLKAQQPESAIALYEHATVVEPMSVDGWRGLFVAQLRHDQAAAALATYGRMPANVRDQLRGYPSFLEPLASAYAAVGRSGEAQTTLEDALKLSFAADQNALKMRIQSKLADVLFSGNHMEQAVAMYQQILAEDAGDTSAWESLAHLQITMGRDQDAFETVERMPAATYAIAMQTPGFEVTVASIYERRKKFDLAENLLQKVVTEETNAGEKPSSAIEMQLANVYAESGTPQLAYPVYQQVLRENPERVDAWAGLLYALHVTGHDKEAVAQVALIPPGARKQLETNQEYQQTMAEVYARLEQTQEARSVEQRLTQEDVAQRSSPPADGEIQRARLLYNGLDDTGLYVQLMSLGGRSDLTLDQRRTVETIWTNWAARRANEASAVNNPRRAVAILNAAARAFPDNPGAIRPLAAAYVQAGQPHQAVVIYKAQNMASASAGEYQAAVVAALAEGDNKDAEIWLRYALAAWPADPQILIIAARFEQARGDTARAIEYYRSSLKAVPQESSGSKLASELGLPPLPGPTSLPSAAQPQDLSVLLAPGYIDAPQAGEQSHLPNAIHSAPLPPYDGTTQLVPPFMTNRDGRKIGNAASDEARANLSPEVKSSPHDESLSASCRTSAPVVPAPLQGADGAEVYSAYVPYVPPMRVARAIGYQPVSTSVVAVQLGNDRALPVQAQADVTDVLPTERFGRSARADEAAASHDQVAAQRAERIQHLREEGAAARSGQSHPLQETMTGSMQDAQYNQPQVARPASPPTGYGAAPDSGAQQYPQPRIRPGSGGVTIAHSRPASHTPAALPSQIAAPSASATQPVVVAPESANAPVVPIAAPDTQSAAAVRAPQQTITHGFPTVGAEYPPPAPPTDAELSARSLPPLGGADDSLAPSAPGERQQAEDELASLEGTYSGWLGVTGMGRYRRGASGLDQLYDLESPAEASAVIAKRIRLTAVAEPVYLNSGTLNPASFSGVSAPYLGTLAANATNPPARQYFNGVGGELQLATKSIALALGYAPYEFPVRNVTGRFLWNGVGNHVALFGDREPVKDTLLSYVGLHDPGSALPLAQSPVWGGVIASTGGLRLQLGDTAASFFVLGEGGILTGQHVLDNYRFKGELGAAFRVKSWVNAGELKLGVTISGMHYQHDEVGLSYGQGGYFSPDTYVLGSVPISFNGRYKTNFHYAITGSVGGQSFRQSAALFYPLDPGLQSDLIASQGAACTVALATFACGEYPLLEDTQFSYNFKSEASYRFGKHWYGGGFVAANNSSNFETVSAGFLLHFVFRAQQSHKDYPDGLFRMDGLRPLQIP